MKILFLLYYIKQYKLTRNKSLGPPTELHINMNGAKWIFFHHTKRFHY